MKTTHETLLEACRFAAELTQQLTPAPDSLSALAERDASVRNWIANERGLILSAEGKARSAIAAAQSAGIASMK